MITNACVNVIVPLAILGLLANFIPYLLIIVPLEEQDVCWFYYLTRSPYQLNYIENWLYLTADYMRYVICFFEMMVLLYYVCKISSMKMNQINIAKESQLITMSWFVLTVLNLVLKRIEKLLPDQQIGIQLTIFTILIIRNLAASGIAYYYSVFLVNRDFQSQLKSKEGELQQNLGTFAIEDFDVAMKSQIPVKYFRRYLLENTEHYKQFLIETVLDNEGGSRI